MSESKKVWVVYTVEEDCTEFSDGGVQWNSKKVVIGVCASPEAVKKCTKDAIKNDIGMKFEVEEMNLLS